MNQPGLTPSPCIRKCSLDERNICRGCFRSIKEILDWEIISNDQRQQILENCRQRRAQRARRCP